VLVKDIVIGAGSSSPQSLVAVGSTLFFTAIESATGQELYKSDGTAAGTVLVKDINVFGSSDPSNLVAVGSTLFFTAFESATGHGIYKSDGTAAGTVLVKATGNSAAENLVVVGSTLFFRVQDSFLGFELFKVIDECEQVASDSCPPSSYAVGTVAGVFCFAINNGVELSSNLTDLTLANCAIGVVGSVDPAFSATYDSCVFSTDGAGNLIKMSLERADLREIEFERCGVLSFDIGGLAGARRKRDYAPYLWAASTGTFAARGAANGDPHLAGAYGIKFDVYGAPGAKYSLLVAPAFEVNMQLATRGPELRFMTAMAVLYRGTSFIITPNTAKTKSAELIAHFEALGSKISISNERITIELCAAHTISFEAQHDKTMSYLNFEMQVPGCHNSYGGLLGQTYQCKYATEKFKWAREREKAFRLATLNTASGSYSPTVECANEDEYVGKPMRGGSFSKDAVAPTH
jgi:ELWxxDGT repeat protein